MKFYIVFCIFSTVTIRKMHKNYRFILIQRNFLYGTDYRMKSNVILIVHRYCETTAIALIITKIDEISWTSILANVICARFVCCSMCIEEGKKLSHFLFSIRWIQLPYIHTFDTLNIACICQHTVDLSNVSSCDWLKAYTFCIQRSDWFGFDNTANTSYPTHTHTYCNWYNNNYSGKKSIGSVSSIKQRIHFAVRYTAWTKQTTAKKSQWLRRRIRISEEICAEVV